MDTNSSAVCHCPIHQQHFLRCVLMLKLSTKLRGIKCLAEKEIIKLCRAKSSRLGIPESKVIASEFRILSCALMKGLASMILNRDSYCDYTDNQMQSLNDVLI